MIFTILTFYLTVVNFTGFAMMGIDKRKARRDQWRIPEKNFFVVAVLGGSPGCYIGMQVFHHKTMHKAFTIGMPAILIVQILLLLVLFGKGYVNL